MLATNYTELRTDLKHYLDTVEQDNETIIVKRNNKSASVIISLEEYNSMMETVHLLSSKANSDWLFESIKQLKDGQVEIKELFEK